jgi:hypothetical protein
MKTISDWPDFVSSIGPYLTKNDPLAAMKQAGIQLGGDVAKAIGTAKVTPLFGAGTLDALTAVYGPPPNVNLYVGRSKPTNPAIPPRTGVLGGFSAVGAADLTVLNQVIAELWRVKTIPQQFSDSVTNHVLTLNDLKATCTGIPADAVLGGLQLTTPPVASSSTITPLNLHFEINFNLPVQTTGAASLRGVFHVEQPLTLHVTPQDTLELTAEAIGALKVTLDVSSVSFLQLQSAASKAVLEGKFVSALQQVWTFLFLTSLKIPAQVGVTNTFPNSKVEITQIGAACVHDGTKNFLVAGINVGAPQTTSASGLTSAAIPLGSNNIHAVSNEAFATDSLAALIKSGDLAEYFNRIIARHVPLVTPPPVVINFGSVSFEDGLLRISLDCFLQNACAFHKDLGFTASVSGIAYVDGDTLSIKTNDVDIDLDDIDAVVCTILGALSGPFSLIITEVILAIVAAYNPTGRNLEYPATDTSRPLPGSDQDFKIALTNATISAGTLTADAVASLIPDITRAFAHLKVVKGAAQAATPLSGATVELLELDSPAPAGDDVKIPATGDTERILGKLIIDDSRSYQPLPDQWLGAGITNDVGYVRIVGSTRAAAGIFTDIREIEDVLTGKIISNQTTTKLIQEYKPDFAVNVTAADGTVLAKRLLIALNNPDKHLGTLDKPFLVQL